MAHPMLTTTLDKAVELGHIAPAADTSDEDSGDDFHDAMEEIASQGSLLRCVLRPASAVNITCVRQLKSGS